MVRFNNNRRKLRAEENLLGSKKSRRPLTRLTRIPRRPLPLRNGVPIRRRKKKIRLRSKNQLNFTVTRITK